MDDDYCGEPPSHTSRSVRGEQQNGKCPLAPAELVGQKKAGQKCTSASDCAPACCDCGVSGSSWLAAACVNGRCAGPSSACLEAEDDARYCGGRCSHAGAPCFRDDGCCSKSCQKQRCE